MYLTCAGSLAYLSNDLNEASALLLQVSSDDPIQPSDFLMQCIEIAKKVRESATTLLAKSKQAMHHLENSRGEVCDTQVNGEIPNWDPGLQHAKLSNNQKKFLISKGPCQPKLVRYPINNLIEGHKQKSFNARWYEEYPHLEYSISKDAAFCHVCQLFKTGNQDPAWCEQGVSTWEKMKSQGTNKKGKLSAHFSSKDHKEAHQAYIRFCEPLSQITSLLSKAGRNNVVTSGIARQS